MLRAAQGAQGALRENRSDARRDHGPLASDATTASRPSGFHVPTAGLRSVAGDDHA